MERPELRQLAGDLQTDSDREVGRDECHQELKTFLYESMSIIGAIQDSKLQKLMGNFDDDQGEWGRFLWVRIPLKALKLPDTDSPYQLNSLKALYQQAREVEPQRYRFTAEAQSLYHLYHWDLEQRRVANSRQGMRAALSKMEGYTARLALVLHVIADLVSGRDRLAKRVGFGSGRTYEKAEKVVVQIDKVQEEERDEEASALRQVLNGQSVDAAYKLLKVTTQERENLLGLIARGQAKTTQQARRMLSRSQREGERGIVTLQGFSVGDRVEVNEKASSHGEEMGEVVEILHASCQISVMLENRSDRVSFCPSELMLVQKAIVKSPYQIGDVVIIDFQEPALVEGSDRCWHGYWGVVRSVSEVGLVEVDVGKRQLSVFPYDLKSVYTSAALSVNIERSRDAEFPSSYLKEVAEKIVKLRGEDLDDLETNMLNFLQRRVEFTERQLQHLEYLLSLYY